MSDLLISPQMVSNLYTMGCTAQVDPKQAIPEKAYTAPCKEVRRLRAQLLLEEAIETINALGFVVKAMSDDTDLAIVPMYGALPDQWWSIEEVIDGCVDTIYVATGTLAAYGVPDMPHIVEVNRANDAKFPGGKATLNDIGKFQKPKDWVGPDHAKVRNCIDGRINLHELGQIAVQSRK